MKQKTYKIFLRTIRNGLLCKVGVRDRDYKIYRDRPENPPYDYRRPDKIHSVEFIRVTIEPLLENGSVEQFMSAARCLPEQVATALEAELNYFNKEYAEPDKFNSEDAKTIKDSLEDLIEGLPGWIKKLLKALNELLDLI